MKVLASFLIGLLLFSSIVLNVMLLDRHGQLITNVHNFGLLDGFKISLDKAFEGELHLFVDRQTLVEGE